MDETELLARRFEQDRPHLRAVAYRMLGSQSEAEDAVQESWLRLSRSDTSDVRNLSGWLTTVVGRVCLDMLRSRRSRGEESFELYAPEPAAGGGAATAGLGAAGPPHEATDPEQQALLADSVGLALLVVLETLDPAERLAFVLHDMFAVPFDDIAVIVDRTPAAARQLASRARRRVQGGAPTSEPDMTLQRTAVEAFLAAARDGDFDALVAVLDPEVITRSDTPGRPGVATIVRGATTVAKGAITFGAFARASRPALVDGGLGVVMAPGTDDFRALVFTVGEDGLIVEIDIVSDPARLSGLEVAELDR
ncbi:sigma-70 family RNA polymerase sigma factor [Streptomyces sp. NPDC051976]|uniref:sigma-70 family RNA polymerase sigma factor n=1 Tax=Streptomyces sp. NPDC051976 TaxID=3154947 RepID=UPI0034214300